MKVPRTALDGFPDVIMHASESAVKNHPNYPAAKAGDLTAAMQLVVDVMDRDAIERIRQQMGWNATESFPSTPWRRTGLTKSPLHLQIGSLSN